MSNERPSQPIAAAWSWSRRRSPLLRLLHWLPHRLRPHARAAAFLRASGLPEPARGAIDAIVRRTRLWSDERLDLARELAAHARDALDAGRGPADTASSLGRPKGVAPLLRRAAKRKRHWVWQARRRILQGAGLAVLALLGVYAVLFVRFNTGSPSITHDYIAELNARNSTYEASRHAYPAIGALFIAWMRERMALMDDEQTAINAALDAGDEAPKAPWAYGRIPYADPDDPAYARLLAAHGRLRPLIDAAVDASSLPTLGVPYTDRYDEAVTDDGLRLYQPLPPSESSTRSPNGLISVLLPWLGRVKIATKPVAFDAVVAARAGDAERAARSLTGAFNIARLTGREHTLIASLVGLSLQTMTEKVALGILHDHPDLFTQEQLAALAHTIAVSAPQANSLDLSSETMYFDDFLQRAFTDDGHGGGRITAEGVRFLNALGFPRDASGRALPAATLLASPVIGPIYQVTMASREELKSVHQRMIDQARAVLDEGPTAFTLPPANAVPGPMHTDRADFPILALLTPSYESAIEAAFHARAHTDATLVAVACHLHRARTGAFPTALDQLDRAVLPEIPPDPFDPGQPIKLRSDGSTLRIYFAGVDGDDDDGTPPPNPENRDLASLLTRYRTPQAHADNPASDGDWIVYPPVR